MEKVGLGQLFKEADSMAQASALKLNQELEDRGVLPRLDSEASPADSGSDSGGSDSDSGGTPSAKWSSRSRGQPLQAAERKSHEKSVNEKLCRRNSFAGREEAASLSTPKPECITAASKTKQTPPKALPG
eukprot:scaffold1436_cov250-Pinguiococcus_pyrenoidosus.AAC.15